VPERHGLARLVGRHGIPLLIAVLALLIVGGALIYGMRGSSVPVGDGGSGGTRAGASDSASAGATVTPAESAALTRWLADNTRAGARIVVPQEAVAAVRAGAPKLHVRGYDDAGAGPADLVVVGSAVTARPGEPSAVTRLSTGGLPVARLSGPNALQVRQVLGASQDAATVATDRAQRVSAGRQLAGNARLHLDPGSAAALRTGEVDPRLLVVLAALTGEHDLTGRLVADADGVPGEVRYRTFEASAIDGVAPARDAAVTRAVRQFLRAQYTRLVPARIGVRQSGGAPLLDVNYGVPVPLNLHSHRRPVRSAQ
jgi:hypothetical protein